MLFFCSTDEPALLLRDTEDNEEDGEVEHNQERAISYCCSYYAGALL